MSIKVMNLVWNSTLDGSSRRFLLLALADRANDAGYCWPGVANLSAKTGMSRSTVFRLLAELETGDSLIQRAKRPTVGQRMGNAYRINLALLRTLQRPVDDEDDEMAALFDDAPSGESQNRTGPKFGPIPDRDETVPDSDLTRPNPGPNTSGDTPPVHKTPSPRKRAAEAGQSELVPHPAKTDKRGTRLTEDFRVTPDMVAWAQVNTPNVDGRFETQKFINHFMAKPGKEGLKLDWVRTWRNWMLNAEQRAPRSVHQQPRPSTTDQRVMAAQALKARFASNGAQLSITGGAA